MRVDQSKASTFEREYRHRGELKTGAGRRDEPRSLFEMTET
jgi:hypothetical protein